MKIRYPDYYKEFKCIANKCTDSCCVGWEVVIDDKTREIYKGEKGELGDRLRKEMIFSNNEYSFRLRDGKCPFLDDDMLCEIHSKIGEEKLCYTCKRYPRFMDEFGLLREEGLSLSCPEAARLILNGNGKVEFITEETDERISGYNNIDASLFVSLLKMRNELFGILSDRECDVPKRLISALRFSETFKKGKFTTYQEFKLNNAKNKKIYLKEQRRKRTYLKIIDRFLTLEYLDNEFKDIFLRLKIAVKSGESFNDVDYGIEFEKIAIYFIYKYFLKAVDDKKAVQKMKLSFLSTVIIHTIFEFLEREGKERDILWVASKYSKEIEHSKANLSKVYSILDAISPDNLVTLLYY